MKTLILLPVLLAALTGSLSAQDYAGDAAAGKALAVGSCAECHVVASEQATTATDGAPTFSAVAKDAAMADQDLRLFLQVPHSTMPTLTLTRTEVEDIVAYIRSLRR